MTRKTQIAKCQTQTVNFAQADSRQAAGQVQRVCTACYRWRWPSQECELFVDGTSEWEAMIREGARVTG